MKIACLGDAHYPGNNWKNFRIETEEQFIVVTVRDVNEAEEVAYHPSTWKADISSHYTDEHGEKHPAYGSIP